MGRLVIFELTNYGLLIKLASHYTTEPHLRLVIRASDGLALIIFSQGHFFSELFG